MVTVSTIRVPSLKTLNTVFLPSFNFKMWYKVIQRGTSRMALQIKPQVVTLESCMGVCLSPNPANVFEMTADTSSDTYATVAHMGSTDDNRG